MTAISITDLNNAKIDVDHIADVSTSVALTSTDRIGNVKDTVTGAVYKISAFNSRGAWVATTAYAIKDLVSNAGTWYVCVVAHTSSAAFATDTASKWRVHQGLSSADANTAYVTPSNIFAPASGGTDTRGVELTFNTTKGALRYGGSDAAPTDSGGFWGGLSGGATANAWGTSANIGLYSVALNRNGAAFGAYATTIGHDCVVYGTAGFAGGAGSCVGDPATGAGGVTAFAFGRYVQAKADKSAAFCENSLSGGRADFAAGYYAMTGASGIAKIALGYRAFSGITTGVNGTSAIGYNVTAENGAMVFGRGINDGNPIVSTEANTVGFGSNVIRPTIEVMPGVGDLTDSGYPIYRGKQQYHGTVQTALSETAQELTNGSGGGYGSFVFRVKVAGVMTDVAKFDAGSTSGIPSFYPTSDNNRRLGSAANRWEVVFSATAAINTSDERLKQQIRPIDGAALRAWGKVEYCQYKFNDAVTEKGDGARWHFGLIAQRVQEAFASEGIDALDYGLLCLDKWVVDGVEHDRYGIRYEEALALECAYLRSKLA